MTGIDATFQMEQARKLKEEAEQAQQQKNALDANMRDAGFEAQRAAEQRTAQAQTRERQTIANAMLAWAKAKRALVDLELHSHDFQIKNVAWPVKYSAMGRTTDLRTGVCRCGFKMAGVGKSDDTLEVEHRAYVGRMVERKLDEMEAA